MQNNVELQQGAPAQQLLIDRHKMPLGKASSLKLELPRMQENKKQADPKNENRSPD